MAGNIGMELSLEVGKVLTIGIWQPCVAKFYSSSMLTNSFTSFIINQFNKDVSNPRSPQLFRIMLMALRITWIYHWNQGSNGDSWIRNHNFYVCTLIFGYLMFSHILLIMWCISPYLVKNQFKNLELSQDFKESKITSMKNYTCGPLRIGAGIAIQ